MNLVCIEEAIRNGEKIMSFTKGKVYTFEEVIDPEGWEVLDDEGGKEVFFNPYIMFKKIDK